MNRLKMKTTATLLIVLFLASIIGIAIPVNAQYTVTVTAPASIQAAIDANPGAVICLDDSGGIFNQKVILGPEDSGITLTAEPGDSPIMDGTGLVSATAITLLDGVHDVTIENLEICNYHGFHSSAIVAWGVSTLNIIVRNNHLHDNEYNGILVGSEGDYIHTNWMVKNNLVENYGFVGIELTNCEDSTIMGNDVSGGWAGIVVQARNTKSGSGLVVIDGVHVLHNTIDDATGYGIYILSITSHPTLFTPITGASSLLSSVTVQKNTFTDNSVAVLFWAYNDAATARNGRIMKNDISRLTSGPGIWIRESGYGQTGTVENVKVVNNDLCPNCDPIVDQGDATKIPPCGPPT